MANTRIGEHWRAPTIEAEVGGVQTADVYAFLDEHQWRSCHSVHAEGEATVILVMNEFPALCTEDAKYIVDGWFKDSAEQRRAERRSVLDKLAGKSCDHEAGTTYGDE